MRARTQVLCARNAASTEKLDQNLLLQRQTFEEMDSYPGRSNERTRLIPPQQHRRSDPPPRVTSFSFTPHDLPTTPIRSKQKRRKEAELPTKDYDSLDYDTCYNIPLKERLRGFKKRTYFHITLMRWTLMGVIGFLTGIVAFLIDILVKYLFQLKYGLLEQVFHWATMPYPGNGQVVLGFLVLLGFNVLFAIIASSLIALKPVATGSGIPEVKCYLNGVKVPHVTRVTTLIAKAVGVLFSVAGGFFVGKEGPMIHIGAVIGAGIPQFRSMFCKWLKLPCSCSYFRSDRDKRDFVSSGAAAGVAAAFGAPIGGVLTSLEQSSSFWNHSLTWRKLFCSLCSTFTLNLFLSAVTGLPFAQLGHHGLVNFGVFTKSEKRLWSAYHLIIFIIMGAVGGLMGALFNSLNTRITIYRMVYLHRRRRIWRVFEALLIIMVTTGVVFVAAMFLGTCVIAIDAPLMNSCAGDNSFVNATHSYYCPNYGAYYNDMATLLFNSQEITIKQLFHGTVIFTLPTLGIMFIAYYFIACWTCGALISGGVFVPCLLIGALYGRFAATVLKYLSSYNSYYFGFLSDLYLGTYTLIGAAAFLGGVVRMTISLTVILIETTHEIDYGLPIMLTLLVAKWVGDMFNEGLYDIHIEVKEVPLLGWESPDHMDRLTAEDVMNSDLHYMFPITRVRSVERLLRTTAHSAFLIVTPVDKEAVLKRPLSVSKMHTPQLYRKQSETTDIDSDTDLPTQFSINQDPHSRTTSTASGIYPTFHPDSSIILSFNLPGHSQGVAIQSTSAYSDEEDETKPKKLLIFHGIILRSQLVMMMKNRIYFREDHGPESQPRISHLALTADYPRYPSVFDVAISESDRNMLMDLSLYMNPSPYTISHQAPLPQAFNLFRTMGLRHLPVMRDSGIVVGIITRHDLTHTRLHEIRHQKKIEAKEQRMRKRSPAEAASITSPVDDVFSNTNDVFSSLSTSSV